jgi:hypothetical protein
MPGAAGGHARGMSTEENPGYAERDDEPTSDQTGGGVETTDQGMDAGGRAHTGTDEGHPAGDGERTDRDVGGPRTGE